MTIFVCADRTCKLLSLYNDQLVDTWIAIRNPIMETPLWRQCYHTISPDQTDSGSKSDWTPDQNRQIKGIWMSPYLVVYNGTSFPLLQDISDNIITVPVPPIKKSSGYSSVSELSVAANKRIYLLVCASSVSIDRTCCDILSGRRDIDLSARGFQNGISCNHSLLHPLSLMSCKRDSILTICGNKTAALNAASHE